MKNILAAAAAAATLLGVVSIAGGAEAQPRAWNGHQYCWYGNGWKGAGWYWCGNQWRRGYGWGGGHGWNGWGGAGVVIGAPGVGVVIGRPGAGVVVGRPTPNPFWGGRHYCWYRGGWKGAGWYQCGYANRRGYGWGGGRGWNNWRDPDWR
ncbi:MAG TPA: hypothetical protein VFE13_09645 [Caulobacteraceae bacterium]|nr:hypothetical protein [Caulobacteraceae bacterium]